MALARVGSHLALLSGLVLFATGCAQSDQTLFGGGAGGSYQNDAGNQKTDGSMGGFGFGGAVPSGGAAGTSAGGAAGAGAFGGSGGSADAGAVGGSAGAGAFGGIR